MSVSVFRFKPLAKRFNGLQNRRVAGNPVTGGFDPHSLPPFVFNWLGFLSIQSQSETWHQNRIAVIKT